MSCLNFYLIILLRFKNNMTSFKIYEKKMISVIRGTVSRKLQCYSAKKKQVKGNVSARARAFG